MADHMRAQLDVDALQLCRRSALPAGLRASRRLSYSRPTWGALPAPANGLMAAPQGRAWRGVVRRGPSRGARQGSPALAAPSYYRKAPTTEKSTVFESFSPTNPA